MVGRGESGLQRMDAIGERARADNQTTPTMPSKKLNREKTIFDVSRMFDTGIFSLQDLPSSRAQEMDRHRPVSDCPALDDSPLLGRLQLSQESGAWSMEEAPVPDDSPVIPLAALPESPEGGWSGVMEHAIMSVAPQEEGWSAKRLGKRPERQSSSSLDTMARGESRFSSLVTIL